VSLALRYNGEVINGDAMQLYSGLPIITNKITVEERKGVPHHLLGCIDFGEPTWVVGTFVKRALRVIEEIRSRGKLPILVGGTHYYTQSLLFRDRLAETEEDGNDSEEKKDEDQGPLDNLEDTYPILKEPTEKLLEKLQEIDPVMAARWHPNDRRKIQRSIEIYLQTGRKASDIYAEQRLASAAGAESSSEESDLRFPTLLFWIHAETETLRTRLDNRVDKMLNRGLLDEVRQLHQYATEQSESGQPVDESRGIWVSIGFKEFKAYITALQTGTANETVLQVLKDEAIERTKIATRQYAKRQTRWIRLKLLHALQSQSSTSWEDPSETAARLYLLDGTSITEFEKNVLSTAGDVTQAFLCDSTMPDPIGLSAAAAEYLSAKKDLETTKTPQSWVIRKCDLCGVTCATEKQWEAHARSRAHRRLVSKKRKLEDDEVAGKVKKEEKAESKGDAGQNANVEG
jgi:tRNA dimethylallyltransferase